MDQATHPLAAPRPAAASLVAAAGRPPVAAVRAEDATSPRLRFDPAMSDERPAPTGDRAEATASRQRFTRHPDRETDFPPETREMDLGWADLLDVINPLQHIPVVSSIYRAITGDEISAPARIMGDTLYGGPVGLIAGVVNAIAEETSGRDFGEMALAAVFGDDAPADTAIAQSRPAPGEPTETAQPAPAMAATAAAPVALSTAAGSPVTMELTGKAALAAFRDDLRGAGRPTSETLPDPRIAVPDLALPEPADRQARRGESGEDRATTADAPRHAFTEQMLRGLDKYRAMALERRDAHEPAARQVDRTL